MIRKHEIMPLVLAKCPGFLPAWEKYQRRLDGKDAGIYNDLGVFAAYVIGAYTRQDTEPVAVAFGIIEELLVGGDEDVRAAATIGFLEDVRNAASWRPFGPRAFVQWLGPESKEAWDEMESLS